MKEESYTVLCRPFESNLSRGRRSACSEWPQGMLFPGDSSIHFWYPKFSQRFLFMIIVHCSTILCFISQFVTQFCRFLYYQSLTWTENNQASWAEPLPTLWDMEIISQNLQEKIDKQCTQLHLQSTDPTQTYRAPSTPRLGISRSLLLDPFPYLVTPIKLPLASTLGHWPSCPWLACTQLWISLICCFNFTWLCGLYTFYR